MKIRIVIPILISLIGCMDNSHSINSSKKENSIYDPKIEKNKEIIQCKNIKLQGVWASDEDKKYRLIITDKLFIHCYKGELDDTLIYKLSNKSIVDSSGKSCFLVAQERNSDETYTYTIVNVSDKTLSLSYIENGDLTVFKKQ
jgi:hypothetical protein